MAKTDAHRRDESSRTKVSFEEALARLEQIVEQLDDGNLPLAKSLDLFKEGTKLAKLCRDLLTQAELAVKEALDETLKDEDEDDVFADGQAEEQDQV